MGLLDVRVCTEVQVLIIISGSTGGGTPATRSGIPVTQISIPCCNGGVLWTRGLSILQLVVLEGRWDTVVQCVW
jgi:hypothetical protein